MASWLGAPLAPWAKRFWRVRQQDPSGSVKHVISPATAEVQAAIKAQHATVADASITLIDKLQSLPVYLQSATCAAAIECDTETAQPQLSVQLRSPADCDVLTKCFSAVEYAPARLLHLQVDTRVLASKQATDTLRQVLRGLRKRGTHLMYSILVMERAQAHSNPDLVAHGEARDLFYEAGARLHKLAFDLCWCDRKRNRGRLDATAAMRELHTCRDLQYVDLSTWSITPQSDVDQLYRGFSTMPAVHSLTLPSVPEHTSDACSRVFSMLAEQTQLQALHASKGAWHAPCTFTVIKVLPHMGSLRSLDLSMCDVVSLQRLQLGLMQLTALTQLHLKVPAEQEDVPALAGVAAGLSKLTAMADLDLLLGSEEGLDLQRPFNAVTSKLAGALACMPRLAQLRVQSVTSDAACMACACGVLPSLTSLTLAPPQNKLQGMVGAAANIMKLRKLSVRHCFKSTADIAASLLHMRHLAELDLAHNGIRAAAAPAISKALVRMTAMERLQLNANELRDEGATQIVLSTVYLRRLSIILLADNRISGAWLSEMQAILPHGEYILRRCDLVTAGVRTH